MMRTFTTRTTHLVSLGQPLYEGVPHYPTHPPYLHVLTRLHGDGTGAYNAYREGASDGIAMGTHVGTHIDSVVHISENGFFHGGVAVSAEGVQDYSRGINIPGVENLKPILGRGVLLDFAGFEGAPQIPPDYAITPERVAACLAWAHLDLRPDDVVLFRTGWDLLWRTPGAFVSSHLPGPNEDTARLLSKTKVQATGSDTIAYELYPHHLEGHAELLVHSGIPIIECLNLQELARRHLYEFQFVALPLALQGATGSPINPLAIVGWEEPA